MSEKELENKEYVKEEGWKMPPKLKKWFDIKLLLLLGVVGKMLWTTFTTGAEVQYQAHFQESLQTVGAKAILKTQMASEMDDALEDKNFLAKAFSSDGIIDEIDKQIVIAKKHIVDEVVSADSSKIDFVGYIGAGSGIRNEDILPMFVELMKAIDNGELIFKSELDEYIKKEVKKQTTRVVRADF